MSSMQQWAFLAMQDKEGKLSPDKSSAFQELKNRAAQAGQTLAQYVEPALAVGSGMAGHLAGIAVGAGGIGMGVDAAENAYNRTQDWMTYRPRTESGQAGLEWLGDKSQVVGDAVNKAIGQGAGAVISAIPGQTAEAAPAIQAAITNKGVSKSVEDYITEATGSETAGTLASWVPGAVELVAGGKGIMNAAKLEMGDIGGQGMGNQRGIFAGVKAKGADLDAKAKAEEMLAAGADRDQIWKDTGWMKDVDGQWKWEIDDSGLIIGDNGSEWGVSQGEWHNKARVAEAKSLMDEGWSNKKIEKYSDVTFNSDGVPVANIAPRLVEHNELGGNYDLAQVQFEGRDLPKGVLGSHNPNQSLNTSKIEWNKSSDPTEIRNTVGHELQHSIQTKEGFAKGGGLEQFSDDYLRNLHNKEVYAEKATDARLAARKTPEFKALRSKIDAALDNKDMQTVKELHPQLRAIEDNAARDWELEVAALGDKTRFTPFEQYRRLAGEAEARNVEERINMTPEERRAKAPWRTLDVPESELIVQGQGQLSGIQQSTGKQKTSPKYENNLSGIQRRFDEIGATGDYQALSDFVDEVGADNTNIQSVIDDYSMLLADEAIPPGALKDMLTKSERKMSGDELRDAVASKYGKDMTGMILANDKGDKFAMFLPDASEPGRYRYQELDDRGFSGHFTLDSYDELLDDAIKLGYRNIADESVLGEYVSKPSFSKGNAMAAEVQKANMAKPASGIQQSVASKPTKGRLK